MCSCIKMDCCWIINFCLLYIDMRSRLFLVVLFLLMVARINAQPIFSTIRQGNIWMICDSVGLDFNYSPPKVFLAPTLYPDWVVATLCDTFGRLMYYDKIQNFSDQLVINRDSQWIPSSYNPVGHYKSMNFFLPFTGTPITTYVSFENEGNLNYYGYANVYHSRLNNTLSQGKGNWISSMNHQVTNSDSIRRSGVGLTRHANGRDWWMVAHRFGDDTFYVMLATPDTMRMVHRQRIGSDNCIYMINPSAPANIGEIVFSKDGTKLINANAEGLAEVFDFDRCTGLLSNPLLIEAPDSTKGYWNVCFSPNGRYIYASQADGITFTLNLVQYDLQSTNPALNKVTLFSGAFDHEGFKYLRLGPDDKIYALVECGWNSGHPCTLLDSSRFSIIHNPDSSGLACNFVLNDLYAGRWIKPTWPTMAPNYDLGPIDGSPCDTLGIDTRPADPDTTVKFTQDIWPEQLKVYPNPVQEQVIIESGGGVEVTAYHLYDLQGKVLQESVFKHPNSHFEINTLNIPPGHYVLEVFTNQGVYRRKLVKVGE
jgi:hypothetical protein